MLNDRDDKYEGTEESEYHFSDDDVSYEVETEAPKTAPVTEPKETLLTRLSRSRRLLISAGVFLLLVFIVYRMVAPSSTPSTDIAPTAPPITQQPIAQSPPVTTPQAAPPMVATPTPSPTPQAVAPAPIPPSAPVQTPMQTVNMQTPAPVITSAPPPPPTQAAVPVATPPGVITSPPPPAPAPNMVVVQPQPAAPVPVPGQMYPTVATVAVSPPVAPNATPAPSVTPETTPPTAQAPASFSPPPPPAQTLTVQAPVGTVDLNAENAKLITQLQAEYITRLNDFTNQNKNLQEQVQTLSNRVATVEAEFTQLLQALTRQAPTATTTTVKTVEVEHAQPGRVPYTVQAIIPGRAWLRSDSGETLTVAEGDPVKGLGRVTKIDPYDGVVEINTGSKVISLSYGSGG